MNSYKDEEKLHWHPAFLAAMQIDFGEEAEKLQFISEHELSKMPMRIDVLVIKKVVGTPLRRKIGRILRGHNIFEYKSPTDSLSIDDFYKAYGYTCFYKSGGEVIDEIRASDVTITFVCNHYPRKMLNKLKAERNITVRRVDSGIYYLEGDAIPIQLLLTRKLSTDENLWLKSLNMELRKDEHMVKLLDDYERHHNSPNYQAAMYLIARANQKMMKEARAMGDVLIRALYKEEIDEEVAKRQQEIEQELTIRVTVEVTKTLIETLREEGISDEKICEKIQKKYNISKKEALIYFEV